MLPKYLKDSTFSSYFWSITIFTGNGSLEILIAFVFFHIHFHSIIGMIFGNKLWNIKGVFIFSTTFM